MFDRDGKALTPAQVIAVALAAKRGAPIVIYGAGDSLMTTLRAQVRRSAKAMHAEVRISIMSDHMMIVQARSLSPETSIPGPRSPVQIAMDASDSA